MLLTYVRVWTRKGVFGDVYVHVHVECKEGSEGSGSGSGKGGM